MPALIAIFAVVVLLVAFDLAAFRFGVDSRDWTAQSPATWSER